MSVVPSVLAHESSASERRGQNRVLSVAPMMDRTDRHFRYLLRQLTRDALLYTEMVTTGALRHGDRVRLLGFSAVERPLALQLGGDDPAELAACARIGADWGYDEINLNVGCPSDRVQDGAFGACLMARPRRVAEAVAAMRAACPLPVTVKHRIGIDGLESYADMERFVTTVAAAGCDRFTVHARIAILDGLTPRQNRQVPPLRHGDVYRLKRDHPELVIELNGGVCDLAAVRSHLAHVDAVMIGRAAYERPTMLATVDRELFGRERPAPRPADAIRAMLPYLEDWCHRGGRLHDVTRHMLTLFAGQPGARRWRRTISENAHRAGAGPELVERALAELLAAA